MAAEGPQQFRRSTDQPRPRRFRKGIYILPSLATTFNIGLGYYALWHIFSGSAAEPWHFDNAAKAIGFAVVADGIDGRIARMTGTESDFGREFDSLADVITFGVAPALLAWIWGFKQLGPLNGTDMVARTVQLGALVELCISDRRCLPPGSLQYRKKSAAFESGTSREALLCGNADSSRRWSNCCRGSFHQWPAAGRVVGIYPVGWICFRNWATDGEHLALLQFQRYRFSVPPSVPPDHDHRSADRVDLV